MIKFFKPRYWYHRVVDCPYILAMMIGALRYFPMDSIMRDMADICELRGHDAFEKGDWQYAFTLWRYGQNLRDKIAEKQGYYRDNNQIILKFNPWCIAIGHLCSLAHLITLKQQGLICENIVIYDDGQNIANRFLFDLLSPFISVKSYDEYCADKDKIDVLATRMVWLCDHYYWDLFAQISPEYYGLLSLNEAQKNDFYDDMQSLGLRRDGWFVTLHLRGNAYAGYDDYPQHQQHSHRNSDIGHYLRACQQIFDAGGQVVLLGDSDKILSDDFVPYVIDYAHSDVKSAQNDVMLCAENLFFIGNNSGINQVPRIFGKNILLSDQIPYIHQTTRQGDLWLPKKLYHHEKQRFLTMAEIFNAPYCVIENADNFAQYGIAPIDNDADELLAALRDMLMQMGVLASSDDSHDNVIFYQQEARDFDPTITQQIHSKIAPSFIKNNIGKIFAIK